MRHSRIAGRALQIPASIASTFAPSRLVTSIGGVEARVDPDLRIRGHDERLYEAMSRDDTVKMSLAQIADEVVAEGFFVQASNSGTQEADDLADLAESWWGSTSVNNLIGPLISELAPALLATGWAPVRIAWDRSWEFDGTEYYSPIQVKACIPWEFGVSIQVNPLTGDRDVLPRFKSATNSVGDPLQYIPMSYGGTHPYGVSVLRGNLIDLWVAKARLDRVICPTGLRAAGILTASPISETETSVDDELLGEDLAQFVDDLSEGWGITSPKHVKLTHLDTQDTESYLEFVSALRMNIRQAILNQNLTSEIGASGSTGSLAASKTHEGILDARRCELARRMAINATKILRRFFLLNSDSVRDVDLPHVQSHLLDRVNAERAKTFVLLGGKLDGRRVGRSWKLPVAYSDDDPGILERQEPGALGLIGGGGGGGDDSDDKSLKSRASQRALSDALGSQGNGETTSLLDELFRSHQDEEQPSIRALIEDRRRAHLSANPSGASSPKAPPR